MSQSASRRLEMLGEFAELLLATARDLHGRGLAADDNTEAARLADSLHRTGRGLRQTLALHAKLERDEKRGVVEDDCEARSEAQRIARRRRDQLAARVERVIWNEHEADDAEDLVEQLATLLDGEELEDAFTTDPMEHLVSKLCAELGLSPPPCGEGAGGGGVGAAFDAPGACAAPLPDAHSPHPHPNPSPQGGGAYRSSA